MSIPTRRSFLSTLIVAPVALGAQAPSSSVPAQATPTTPAGPTAYFPSQEPDLVREMVGASHVNFARVKELVDRRPALAKAAWDWGFGDWETALGASSHVGTRPIAEYLLAHGAHPTIFSAAMLGDLDVVKAFVTASPGIERTKGPHSLPLAHHARMGGERAKPVLDYLSTLPGADEKPANAPLSDGDITRIVGTYVFGTGAEERVEITEAKRVITFTRTGHVGRNLSHLGELAFVPAGSEAVRIRFAASGSAVVMTVHDPDVVMTASKTALSVTDVWPSLWRQPR